MGEEFLVVTTENVPGYRVKRVLGLVSASTVRAKHIGKDIKAAFKNIIGGEISDYTELLAEARETALQRLVDKARKMGANAVLGARLSTAQLAAGAAEILVYGTAVVMERMN